MESNCESANAYQAQLFSGLKLKFGGTIIDYVKEIECEENNLYALVAHTNPRSSPIFRSNRPAGFLIVAKLEARVFKTKIYTIIEMKLSTDSEERRAAENFSSGALIQQPGKNKVLFISFRNSNQLFEMRTDDNINEKIAGQEKQSNELPKREHEIMDLYKRRN